MNCEREYAKEVCEIADMTLEKPEQKKRNASASILGSGMKARRRLLMIGCTCTATYVQGIQPSYLFLPPRWLHLKCEQSLRVYNTIDTATSLREISDRLRCPWAPVTT